MSDEPIFPKKTSTQGQEEAPPVVIERSDDPNFGKSVSRSRPSLPSMQGKQVGCGSSVFLVMLMGIGILALVAVRAVL